MSFLDLYDAIQSPDCMNRFVNSRVFEPSESQTESVEILNNELRNEFTHFLPKTNMIPIPNLLLVVSDCVEIMSFLAFDSNNILWYPQELESKTGELITRTKNKPSCLKRLFILSMAGGTESRLKLKRREVGRPSSPHEPVASPQPCFIRREKRNIELFGGGIPANAGFDKKVVARLPHLVS